MDRIVLFDDADPSEASLLEDLYRLEVWPQDPPTDLSMVRATRQAYPMIDLGTEVKRFVLYWSEPERLTRRKGVRWRDRFRNWCANAERFRTLGGRTRRPSTGGQVPPHGVGRPGDYGDSDGLVKF